MMTQSIGAIRVCSEKHIQHDRILPESRLQQSSLDVIALIPYWPQTTSVKDIVKRTGIRWCRVYDKLTVLSDRYLIFEDEKGKVSRLKDDLSNCDIGVIK